MLTDERSIIILVGIIIIAYFTRYLDRKFFNKHSSTDDAIKNIAGDISLSWKGYALFFTLSALFLFAVVSYSV